MHRRTVLALAGTTLGLPGCVTSANSDVGTTSADSDYDVGMTVNAFAPETVEVAAGETVVWENTSSRGHTVTAYEDGIPEDAAYFASGGFESEAAARRAWDGRGDDGIFYPTERYEHRFEVPGTYEYVCLPHERHGMVGTVIVRE